VTKYKVARDEPNKTRFLLLASRLNQFPIWKYKQSCSNFSQLLAVTTILISVRLLLSSSYNTLTHKYHSILNFVNVLFLRFLFTMQFNFQLATACSTLLLPKV
jgi:hypothetical protein